MRVYLKIIQSSTVLNALNFVICFYESTSSYKLKKNVLDLIK